MKAVVFSGIRNGDVDLHVSLRFLGDFRDSRRWFLAGICVFVEASGASKTDLTQNGDIFWRLICRGRVDSPERTLSLSGELLNWISAGIYSD